MYAPDWLIAILTSACQCNKQAKTCDRVTGNCDCMTKGVGGVRCDRYDVIELLRRHCHKSTLTVVTGSKETIVDSNSETVIEKKKHRRWFVHSNNI